jgi:nitrite reductase/ring-hydroxylating ferredoxin subunit
MPKYVVARSTDVPEGERIIVDINQRSVGIFNVDGNYYAVLNRCPHQGAELCRGAMVSSFRSERPGQLEVDASRKYLACPWHGWEFDLATGQSYFDPMRTRVRPYPVEVERGELVAQDIEQDGETRLVKGPHIAETLPISVEDDYLVITLRR